MKKISLTFFTIITLMVSFGQSSGTSRSGQSMSIGHFYGKIIDAQTNKALESVSVQLYQNKLDSATKKRKQVVVAGMLTTKKGEFSLESLSPIATYTLKISAIGYKTIEQKIFFDLKNVSGDMSKMLYAIDKDLGNIKIETDTKQLAEVNVTAERSLLQLGLDRKVFNVEKSLTSTGGTAIDVMKNVPSVNVDIDGNISLRNAAPQIFVDGRPSTLSLEQIPADAISSVEIITNPSAKFDASGGGSGILNIVLKKNRKAGYNGSIRANIDSRLRFGGGGDINVRQGKINFFGNAMFNQRKSVSTVNTTRTDFLHNGSVLLQQDNAPVNKGYFAFGRAGIDYFADNRNAFTIAGIIVSGNFNLSDLINIKRDSNLTGGYFASENGVRNSEGSFSFHNYGSTFSYKHNFTKSGKETTADVNYNQSKNSNEGFYQTQYYFTANNPKRPMLKEQNSTGGTTKFFTAQTDFVNPITDKIKLEMGARIAIRDFTSFNENLFYDPGTDAYISISGLNSNYTFEDKVYAAYSTFSQQIKKFSYQLGLRVESSEYKGILINKESDFKNNYPFSLFPSVFLSQKLNDKQSLQLNYSRKINRPGFFQLIPYIDFSDSLNLSKGNPNLVPEFTNLFELSYQVDLNKGNNLLATVYFRNTDDLITRYQYRDVNPNPSKTDSVIISSFANANNSYSYGLELTAKAKITAWWEVTPNLNFYNSKINGNNIESNLQSERVSWFGKINNTFKIPKNYSIQLVADYQSKSILPQTSNRNNSGGGSFGGGQLSTVNGFIKSNYGIDIAIKKDFLKNNTASLTLSVNDVFRTRKYSTHAASIYFVQDNDRRRDPQVLKLNFTWKYGKFDMSLFKRKNMKAGAEDLQGSMQSISQ